MSELVIGKFYKFQGQTEKLKYIGKDGNWHQFEKVGEQGVWAEILGSDLRMIVDYE